jgi:hypothetical protein
VIKQFWYISHLVDYQVVDTILWYKYIIMKVELLRLDSTSKPHPYPRVSQRSELIYTLQGIKPDNTTHVSYHEWPQFMKWSKSRARSYLALVSSSTWEPQRAIRGWPDTIPYNIHKRDKVSSNSVTHEATKFARPHKSRMHQYIINDYSFGPNRCGPISG